MSQGTPKPSPDEESVHQPTNWGHNYVDVDALPWLPSRTPGSRQKILFSDEATGRSTVLFDVQPGATIALHEHPALEQTFILEGRLVDLIGGRIQVMFALPVDTVQLAKDGRIKIVATADSRRSPVFPDVPTFHEAGVPDFEATSWFGLVVPSASPRAAMARLNEILNAVTDKADFRARLTAQGTEPAGGSIADVARFIQTEKIKWEPMVRASGAKSNQ